VFGQPAVPSVAPADVAPDAFLIDVREPYEWQAGHVENALHIPMGEIQQRLDEIPLELEVIVVCKVGGRSGQVTGYLNTVGRTAVNLDGGMHAWEAAGRPMVSETSAPPAVV
jgi:rhodanese-related sulfurtransferase